MKYQVGGSLRSDDPTYIVRRADEQLYVALKANEFCYILSSRQMGKSSLLQRTSYRLQAEGYACTYLDMTQLGSATVTPRQWYRGITTILFHQLDLAEHINLKQWWEQQPDLSPVQQLHQFIEHVLLPNVQSERIFIFIDEIDSLLSLNFSADDFLAWIRHCYEQRIRNPNFNRLGFALFGVATASELISDKRRTPFNIGTAIELHGFQLHEATPLLNGLEPYVNQPQVVLQEIIHWTNGQPFLTQKLCQLVLQAIWEPNGNVLTLGTEAFWVEQLVQSRIIQRWESQDTPEHLKTIRDRLLYSEQKAGRLLGLYQQILLRSASDAQHDNDPGIPISDSPEQTELVLTGLVEKRKGKLQVKNPIYQRVFNLDWLGKQLVNLRPYSQAINAWLASDYADASWLLRGQALRKVLAWAQDKSLADLDYRFLAASQEFDRQDVQKTLEAERLKEVETRLELERRRSAEQQRHLQQQRLLLGIVSVVMIIAIALGLVAFSGYQRVAVNEVQALVAASAGSLNSEQNLDALVQALSANQKLRQLRKWQLADQDDLQQQSNMALQHAALDSDEFNRLTGHRGAVLAVAVSPNGKWIATASSDRTIRLWKQDGTSVWSREPGAAVYGLAFRPDSQMIAAAGVDGDTTLWALNGEMVYPIMAHETAAWGVAFSPDGKMVATTGADRTLKLWTLKGNLVRTFSGHQSAVWRVAFSPNGQLLASASLDGTVKVWRLDGSLVNTFDAHKGGVWTVAFSPNGEFLLSGGADKTLRLWKLDGTVVRNFDGHTDDVISAGFSPDGQTVVSSSADRTIRLWALNGTLLKILRGHTTVIRDVTFSPSGDVVVSASDDSTVRFWRVKQKLFKRLYGHNETVKGLAFSPDSQIIASASGKALNLWRRDGSSLKTLSSSDTQFLDVDFSPDGQTLASAASDGKIRFWQREGSLVAVLDAHSSPVIHVAYSLDGQLLISADDQHQIKLWQRNPQGEFELAKELDGPQSQIRDIAFSRNGKFIASVDEDGSLWFWLVEGANTPLFRTYVESSGPIWGVSIVPDSLTLAISGYKGELQLWNLNGILYQTLKGGSTGFTKFAFSLDSEMIAAVSIDNTIELLRSDGTQVASLKGQISDVVSLIFSPDRTLLVSGGTNQSMTLWDVQAISKLDWLAYACNWVQDYLQTNAEVKERDRSLCKNALQAHR